MLCRRQHELALKTELELLELNLVKQERALLIHDGEERYYAEQQTRLGGEIGRIQQEITTLKDVLEEERQLRKNKDEYDSISREILKFSSRGDLLRSLEKVQGEIEALANRQNDIQRFIEVEALAGYEAVQNIKRVRRQVDLDLKSVQ